MTCCMRARAVLRAQITASVTFLPLLDEPCAWRRSRNAADHDRTNLCALRQPSDAATAACPAGPWAVLECTGTFDLLVYTDAASAVPSEWCAAREWMRQKRKRAICRAFHTVAY